MSTHVTNLDEVLLQDARWSLDIRWNANQNDNEEITTSARMMFQIASNKCLRVEELFLNDRCGMQISAAHCENSGDSPKIAIESLFRILQLLHKRHWETRMKEDTYLNVYCSVHLGQQDSRKQSWCPSVMNGEESHKDMHNFMMTALKEFTEPTWMRWWKLSQWADVIQKEKQSQRVCINAERKEF